MTNVIKVDFTRKTNTPASSAAAQARMLAVAEQYLPDEEFAELAAAIKDQHCYQQACPDTQLLVCIYHALGELS
jgi:tryptophanase